MLFISFLVLLWEKLGSSCQCSKELQVSTSISVQARFVSDTFSWKRTGLARVGVERHRLRAGRGKGGQSRGGQSIRSFVLRTYIVGRMGMKKLHIDGQGKVGPAFLGGHDHPNVGMCGGLLARVLILLQTPFVHRAVKQV